MNEKKQKTPLLPVRYPIQDFFVCDVMDTIPKDDMASMEHPIFSLSTKPDRRILRYEHNGSSIEITPSMKGLATIHDKDILIYCISQMIAKMNAGGEPQKILHLKAYDLLISTNRNIDGRGYEQLSAALDRLSGTRITTNIKTNGEAITEGFGLVDSWRVIRHTDSGRMIEVRINLSDWVFNAVLGGEVLTLHRDYFRLRKPLERRMYEMARKHCGRQDEWVVSLKMLKKKCGSISDDYEFRRLVKTICEEDVAHNHMPDYAISLDGENVRFTNRQTMKPPALSREIHSFPVFDPETYHDAKTVAPGYDVYYLEQEWREFWVDTGKPELRDPGSAFIAFCKRRYEKKANP